MIKKTLTPQGFTLLMASLVASILLALGLAIFNIVQKELILTSAGRESQFAFYAAGSGIECALYWDYVLNAFSTSSPQQPLCAGGAVSEYLVEEGVAGTYTTSFSFSLGASPQDPCTTVVLTREFNPQRTTLVASGYNTCVSTNPRRIERAIRVQY